MSQSLCSDFRHNFASKYQARARWSNSRSNSNRSENYNQFDDVLGREKFIEHIDILFVLLSASVTATTAATMTEKFPTNGKNFIGNRSISAFMKDEFFFSFFVFHTLRHINWKWIYFQFFFLLFFLIHSNNKHEYV